MSAAEQQWIEIKNEKGEVYYFNKITGITMADKPMALRQAEMDSFLRPQHTSYQTHLTGGVSQSKEDLQNLFAERNLNLPKTQTSHYQQQQSQAQAFSSQPHHNNISVSAMAGVADPNTQYMAKALDSALKSDSVRDIYPAMNYFRTEEKQSDSKKFKSFDNLSREDAAEVYKEALRDAGVTSSWKWEDANRVIMHDPRIKAIKAISERKTAFNDYIADIKAKERTDARQRRQQQKEGFLELLREQKNLHGLSKFYQVAKTFQSDPRFKNIEDKDREEIFQDYIDELLNREREEKREQSERTIEKLKEHFGKISVPINSKWLEVSESLSNDPIFSNADPFEQISAFEDYIKTLEREEFHQKKLEKRRQERKNRENFVKLLEEKLQSRELTHRLKWKAFVKLIRDDSRYFALIGQPGSTAHELFEDALNEEKDLLKIHKPPFKTLVKIKGIRFPSNVQFEEFDQKLTQYPEYEQLSQKTKAILHEYYLYKVKQKEQEKAKKVAKIIKSFEKYLKNIINVNKSIEYAYYKHQIDKMIDYTSLTDEQKLKAFNDTAAYLKEQESKRQRKRSRSRRRSSRSSSEESGEVKAVSSTSQVIPTNTGGSANGQKISKPDGISKGGKKHHHSSESTGRGRSSNNNNHNSHHHQSARKKLRGSSHSPEEEQRQRSRSRKKKHY